jgi:hypothetical protein
VEDVMTTRTFALLLLFVLALGLSAVLVAAIQPMAVRFDASTPWVVPLAAIVCYSATFFAGRHYILPFAVSHSAVRALATLVAVTVVSMGLAYGLVRLTRMVVVGVPGVVALLIWFGALWLAVAAVHWTSGPIRRLRS